MPRKAVPLDLDTRIRHVAFQHVQKLTAANNHLSFEHLKPGFDFEGTRIPLVSPRGIFKPQQMRFLLSVKTVVPKKGGKIWYDDQVVAHNQIYDGSDTVEYAFMGNNPEAADNRWLREAMEYEIPVIYFLGVEPARYLAITHTYITGWNPKTLKASISFGLPHRDSLILPSPPERRYALREVKQRLHQDSFRSAVIAAYNGRCALSGLRERRLLDAAHIISDKDELMGQPIVPNGLPLSKIHHAAFDANLLGIDPDFRVHVSESLLDQRDGPMLDALKQLHGGVLHLPIRDGDQPDRDRLAIRFESFKTAA